MSGEEKTPPHADGTPIKILDDSDGTGCQTFLFVQNFERVWLAPESTVKRRKRKRGSLRQRDPSGREAEAVVHDSVFVYCGDAVGEELGDGWGIESAYRQDLEGDLADPRRQLVAVRRRNGDVCGVDESPELTE
jgi:hypothetical protein